MIGIHILLASSSPWIINLGAFTHMSDTPLVTIVDGQICLIKGHDTIIVTSTLPLTQVFYVLNFLTNFYLSVPSLMPYFVSSHFFPFIVSSKIYILKGGLVWDMRMIGVFTNSFWMILHSTSKYAL